MRLSELNVGEEAEVVKIDVDNKALRRHLLDMGLTKGVIVKVKKKAPMGNPIDIMLRDYELCISTEDLEKVQVKVLKK